MVQNPFMEDHQTGIPPVDTEYTSASPSSPVSNTIQAERCSEKYYFDDEMAIFLVENKLFKIHRHFLKQESDIFRLMFAHPPQTESPEGSDDSRPIPLPEVKSCEFERLIDFFYNGMCRLPNAPLDPPILEKKSKKKSMKKLILSTATSTATNTYYQQWTDLLSISTRYAFDRVRERAIDMIHSHTPSLDPIKKIVLAEKYDIPQWLAPAFKSLCQRPKPLEVDEATRIGVVYTALLAQAREILRKPAHFQDPRYAVRSQSPIHDRWGPRSPSPKADTEEYDATVVGMVVDDIFFPNKPASDQESDGQMQ